MDGVGLHMVVVKGVRDGDAARTEGGRVSKGYRRRI